MTRDQDRLGLYVAIMFVAFAIAICLSALFAPAQHRHSTKDPAWQSTKNQPSVESFTTTQARAKKSRGQAPSRKCTATFASTLQASTRTGASSANRARRTAKSRASLVAGSGPRASDQTSKLTEGRPSEESGAKPLSLGDTSVLPPARPCGARVSVDRGLGAGRCVVRLTGGFSGPIGFDTERESEVIVQAVSVRFEQLANPNCKRQRSFRPSHRGLNRVGRARLSSSALASTPTRDRSRQSVSAAQIQRMVEGTRSPGSIGRQRASNADYARERTSEANFVDPGSIPGGSTTPKPGIAQQQESATRLASVALRATGSAAARPGSFGGFMPEELGPIPWRVWLKSNPSKVARVQEVTRREAMLKGAQLFGASARLWDVDCEVERAA